MYCSIQTVINIGNRIDDSSSNPKDTSFHDNVIEKYINLPVILCYGEIVEQTGYFSLD